MTDGVRVIHPLHRFQKEVQLLVNTRGDRGRPDFQPEPISKDFDMAEFLIFLCGSSGWRGYIYEEYDG